MGASWLREEWKPNMAKLEVSVVLDERTMSELTELKGRLDRYDFQLLARKSFTVTRSLLFNASEQWVRKNFLEIMIHSAPLLTC